MDKATPLFEASKNATIITNDNKSKQKQSCTTPRPQSKIEDSRKNEFPNMPCIRKVLQRLLFCLPDSTVNIIISSWRNNTKATYSVYIKQWIEYCTNENIYDINVPVNNCLKFLTQIFETTNVALLFQEQD